MTIYNVLQPPAKDAAGEASPADFVFIKEGFCWPALFIAAIWLLWRRMWLVFILYLVAALAIGIAADRLPDAVAWAPPVFFAFLFALEANNLRRWTLERRGYRQVGVALGNNAGEAELRFFSLRAAAAARQSPPPPAPAPRPLVAPPSWDAGEIVGLFPRPGGGSP